MVKTTNQYIYIYMSVKMMWMWYDSLGTSNGMVSLPGDFFGSLLPGSALEIKHETQNA